MQLLLFVLFCSWASAHQTSVTAGGSGLFWPDPNVKLFIRTNTADLTPAIITNTVLNSMNQWNSTNVVNLTSVSASNNEVRFSSDFSIYGSAVIGVTEISYNNSGAINKAVILLNDNYTFTNFQNSFGGNSVYLGDVVTHELGHLYGLSHSEVLSSSMFFTSFPGQSTISSDDRSGIHQKYGGSPGSIYGKVLGGNHIGVLGVHVQAISRTSGEAVGVITDEDGNFLISGLNLNDSYYIYTAPLKNLESLPGYFANVQKEFCPGTYVGSFFSSCGKEFEGYPQPITLTADAANRNIGVITINCGLKADEDYSYQKIQSSFAPVTIWGSDETNIREKSFVGYFNSSVANSATWSPWETLRVDLSGIPSGPSRALKIDFLAQPFGNLLQYEMRMKIGGSIVATRAITFSPTFGTYTLDMSIWFGMNGPANGNVFDLEVRAQKLPNSVVPLTFPSSTLFASSTHLPYLLMLGVFDGADPQFGSNLPFLSDNDNCLDAPYTYKVSKSNSVSEGVIGADESDAANPGAGCGTIEPPGSNGPGSSLPLIAMGFALALLSGYIAKKSKNFLS